MGLNVDELNWKRVDDGFDEIEGGFDDGIFYGLEEIDDVALVKENGSVKFVPKNEKPKTTKKTKGTKESKESKESKEPKENKNSKENKPSETIYKTDQKEKKKKQPKKTAKSVKKDDDVDDDNAFKALTQDTEVEPAYSLGSWPPNLDWRIYTGLKKLGYLSPTLIQSQSIPLILNGSDVIGKAATGSGKTLAYSIPLMQRYFANPTACDSRPEGLIVSPTRELAHQISDHLKAVLPQEEAVRIVALTGGLAIQKQLRLLSKSPIVVVATPGRLLEILEQMSSKQQEDWQKIPSLVLDEADRLVKSGSFAELESTLKIIGISHQRQVLVFSATFNTELWASLSSSKKRKRGNDIMEIMQKQLGLNSKAQFLDADPESQVSTSVLQAIIECPNMEKDLYLYYFLLLYPGKSVVFVNSIDAVKRIVPLLKEMGLGAIGVHSDMIQKQRLRSIERFKEIPNGILVATDVAARGLDVPLVDHVVQYHLPRSGDMYVHRSGRTARAGNMGVSVVLCSPQEASGPLPALLKLIGTKPSHIDVDYDVLEKLRERVRLAKKIADTQSMATKKGKTEAWLTEAADELGIDVDDDLTELLGGDLKRGGSNQDIMNANVNKGGSATNVAALKLMRTELGKLLQQKLGVNSRYLTSGSQNLAHAMLRHSDSIIPGKPLKSALEELKSKQKSKPVKAESTAALKAVSKPVPPLKKKRRGTKVNISNVTAM